MFSPKDNRRLFFQATWRRQRKIRRPACRRLLFPLLHAEKGREAMKIADVSTQAKSTVKVLLANTLVLKRPALATIMQHCAV